MQPIYVLNGPNLNLLGVREPAIYGTTTLKEIGEACIEAGALVGLSLVFRQTNHEGQMIDWIHEARTGASGIVINPAGWSFYSVAVLDALKASELTVIEVHLSNIHRRESTYHKSLMSSIATGVICGLGSEGYLAAIRALAKTFGGKAPSNREAARG